MQTEWRQWWLNLLEPQKRFITHWKITQLQINAWNKTIINFFAFIIMIILSKKNSFLVQRQQNIIIAMIYQTPVTKVNNIIKLNYLINLVGFHYSRFVFIRRFISTTVLPIALNSKGIIDVVTLQAFPTSFWHLGFYTNR